MRARLADRVVAATCSVSEVLFGEGCVVFGEGCVIFGEGCVVFGEGCVVFGEGCVSRVVAPFVGRSVEPETAWLPVRLSALAEGTMVPTLPAGMAPG
jgi:hypothetical protein